MSPIEPMNESGAPSTRATPNRRSRLQSGRKLCRPPPWVTNQSSTLVLAHLGTLT